MTTGSLYDRYLANCTDGVVEPPAAFFERHPGVGSETRESIEALYAEMAGSVERPSLDRIGDYEIVRQLDHGGMGLVYLARQQPLERLVVVKVIRPELRASRTARERFRREAAAASKLHHPHLVQVLDVGEEDDLAYLVMEYVPGRPLPEVLTRRPAWSECVRWALQLARALDYAHGEGVVHRDVKPSNIRLDNAGAPKLLDFGVARTEGATAAALTTTFAGSPLYAAPEQLTGASLDGRADVYALGVTLYECVTGRVPFPGDSLEQVLRQVLAADPLPPRRLEPALPRDLDSVLLKAIEKDPARRYATAGAFADDLEALLDDRPVRARPPGAARRAKRWARRHPIGAGAIVLAVLLVAGAFAWNTWEARARAAEARAAVADARRLLDDYRQHREETRAIERKLAKVQEQLEFRYLTAEDDAFLDEHEVGIEARWREREAMFYEVLDHLRRAERLDPDVEGADVVRADLFAEKWMLAITKQDAIEMDFYRDLVAKHDPGGRRTRFVNPPIVVRVATDPPGVEAYRFEYVELVQEPRLVPAPVGGGAAVPPGTRGLRVVRDHGEFRAEDLIVSEAVDAGDRVPVHQDGIVRERVVPRGLEVRPTAAPLLPSPECRIGRTPIAFTLQSKNAMVLLRSPGATPVRLFIKVPLHTRELELSVRMRDAPEGFVRVAPGLWFGEREVTAGEYLVYLNDVAGAKPSRLWEKKDGRYALPEDFAPDWPAVGMTWAEAQAYAAWRTARDVHWRYTLPTYEEWVVAAADRLYPYGKRFRPKWSASCFARAQANVVPVMSYPIDETVYGIYDMSGSAMEWIEGWYDEPRKLRRLGGGSWGQSKAEMFKIPGGTGVKENHVTGDIGMRLVARPR